MLRQCLSFPLTSCSQESRHLIMVVTSSPTLHPSWPLVIHVDACCGQGRAMHQVLCQAYEGTLHVGVRHAKGLNVLLEFGLVEGLFCRAILESFIEEKISSQHLKIASHVLLTQTLFVGCSLCNAPISFLDR